MGELVRRGEKAWGAFFITHVLKPNTNPSATSAAGRALPFRLFCRVYIPHIFHNFLLCHRNFVAKGRIIYLKAVVGGNQRHKTNNAQA